jgi:hypothetical protein
VDNFEVDIGEIGCGTVKLIRLVWNTKAELLDHSKEVRVSEKQGVYEHALVIRPSP